MNPNIEKYAPTAMTNDAIGPNADAVYMTNIPVRIVEAAIMCKLEYSPISESHFCSLFIAFFLFCRNF